MRKHAFCKCKNKDADQLCGNSCLFVVGLSVILFISHFGFEGRTVFLIVPVPGYCLSVPFYMKNVILQP